MFWSAYRWVNRNEQLLKANLMVISKQKRGTRLLPYPLLLWILRLFYRIRLY